MRTCGVRETFVPRVQTLAHTLLSLAASRFPSDENRNHEMAIADRDIVVARMTPAQIAEAQRLAQDWKPKQPVQYRGGWRHGH